VFGRFSEQQDCITNECIRLHSGVSASGDCENGWTMQVDPVLLNLRQHSQLVPTNLPTSAPVCDMRSTAARASRAGNVAGPGGTHGMRRWCADFHSLNSHRFGLPTHIRLRDSMAGHIECGGLANDPVIHIRASADMAPLRRHRRAAYAVLHTRTGVFACSDDVSVPWWKVPMRRSVH